MIKALKGNQLILGLSDENMARLKQDQPIKFNLKDLGLQDLEVVIFNGRTEYEMQQTFVKAGLINPTETIIKDSNAPKN